MNKSIFLLFVAFSACFATIIQQEVFSQADCQGNVIRYYTYTTTVCAPFGAPTTATAYIIANTLNSTFITVSFYSTSSCNVEQPNPTAYPINGCIATGVPAIPSVRHTIVNTYTPLQNVVVDEYYQSACTNTSFTITHPNAACVPTAASASENYVSCNSTHKTVNTYTDAACAGTATQVITPLESSCVNNVASFCNGQTQTTATTATSVTTATVATTGSTTTTGTTTSNQTTATTSNAATTSSATTAAATTTAAAATTTSTTSSAVSIYPVATLLVLAAVALL